MGGDCDASVVFTKDMVFKMSRPIPCKACEQEMGEVKEIILESIERRFLRMTWWQRVGRPGRQSRRETRSR